MNDSVYRVYSLTLTAELVDIVQAILGQSIDMEGISYENDGLQFFVSDSHSEEFIADSLKDLQTQFPFTFTVKTLEDKNWNAIWEADFKSVAVRDFCRIRAPFHKSVSTFKYEIIVHPGMAFGTGHHETTWMMIDAMRKCEVSGKRVLDAGCGTGVLAILASVQNAAHIDAFDYDPKSVESTQQNMILNHVHNINVTQAEVADFQGKAYDIICANINRNVILQSLSNFKQMLAIKGMIVVSGYLEEDKSLVQESATAVGLNLQSTTQKGEWICQVYQ